MIDPEKHMPALVALTQDLKNGGADINEVVGFFMGVSIGVAQAQSFPVDRMREMFEQIWSDCEARVKATVT